MLKEHLALTAFSDGKHLVYWWGKSPIKAILDPYNPLGSTNHVNFNTSKMERLETDSRRCHINWVILDSDWEAEYCRVAESHPREGRT